MFCTYSPPTTNLPFVVRTQHFRWQDSQCPTIDEYMYDFKWLFVRQLSFLVWVCLGYESHTYISVTDTFRLTSPLLCDLSWSSVPLLRHKNTSASRSPRKALHLPSSIPASWQVPVQIHYPLIFCISFASSATSASHDQFNRGSISTYSAQWSGTRHLR